MSAKHILSKIKMSLASEDEPGALEQMDHLEGLTRAWRKHIQGQRAAEAQADAARRLGMDVDFNVTVKKAVECSRKAVLGSTLKVQYVGHLLDEGGKKGKVVESSFHTGSVPLRVKLGSKGVLEGWTKGLVGVCRGDQRKVRVPYGMAYGAKGKPPHVPPYANLEYFFEVTDVKLRSRDDEF
eukprot:g3256.t1